MEERLSSCGQLLGAEARSDSTRLRIDYQSWQFNGRDGWSAAGLTSLKYTVQQQQQGTAATYCKSFSKKHQINEREREREKTAEGRKER